MKKGLVTRIVGTLMLAGGALYAASPVSSHKVSPERPPDLSAAQGFSQKAFDKIIAAQKANEWDMQGHAQKAKDLLDQVNAELKLAAEAASENSK